MSVVKRWRKAVRKSARQATEREAAPIGDSPGYTTECIRQDGRDGALWSPLWRVRVELTAAEQALLQSWPLHRLHFLHHNGASVFAYPLTVSRLQHTLGVLALVTYFCPDDWALRVAALLHDVGHFPFCHSAELVSRLAGPTPRLAGPTPRLAGPTPRLAGLTPRLAGLTPRLAGLTPRLAGLTPRLAGPGHDVDHHAMTQQRVTREPICGILRAHGMDPDQLLALMDGDPPNPLRTYNGLLHLDHLDSWARQAQAAGYAETPAHELLARLRLEGNNVAADRATAEYLVRLIRQGNERHYAEGDVGPATVLAHVLALSLERGFITLDELADATDEALLARLAATGDDEVGGLIALLRREPWRIVVHGRDPGDRPPEDGLVVSLDALYDAVPLLAGTGQPITRVSASARDEMARVRRLAGTFCVTWR